MNWKLFSAALINLLFIAFPYNIIGCGPSPDPYDYYTSFFHNDLSNAKGYRPFYYTGMSFFYDEAEPVKTEDLLANEWAGYAGVPVKDKDAYDFVMKYPIKDVNNLYMHLEKNQPLAIPAAMKSNTLTNYFVKDKDLEGLGYIIYAKKTESYTGGSYGEWESIKRDSLKMNGLIKNAIQLHKAAKQDFYKLRYAYQMLRLSHYSGNYKQVISLYDEFVAPNKTQSILQQLSLSLKAGALFHTNRRKEAAYLFSKAFAMGPAKRVSNYLGFDWSAERAQGRKPYLALAKNDQEKAWITAMFSMSSPHNELESLKQVFELDPASEALEILAIREINKLEEQYLTPRLGKEKGGKSFYYYWTDNSDSVYKAAANEASKLPAILHDIAKNKSVKTPALFEIGAAYTSYMHKDYRKARQYLTDAKDMEQSEKLKDQWALTNLLVTISESDKVNAAFEEQLLPSIQWLETKALKDEEWKKSYRNLLSEVIAQRYHAQGELHKEILALGAADYISNITVKRQPGYEMWMVSAEAINHMRERLGSADVEKLFNLIDIKGTNKFENYLISHNSVSKNKVIDFAGTSYLREYNYEKAIEWFKKVSDPKALIIKKNPFIDLTYDQEEALAVESKFSTTKILFAQEMKTTLALAESDKTNAGKHLYKYALGLYNMTYYGHAWELVQYYRSGSDGYHIPKNATAFQREYYGCFTAEKYFEKAMQAGTVNNFKAKCLFMMAKCSQKQVQSPQYDDYLTNYEAYETAQKKYWNEFKRNKHWPQFVKEFSSSEYYKTMLGKCSYLKEFVASSKK